MFSDGYLGDEIFPQAVKLEAPSGRLFCIKTTVDEPQL
tara:strand:- start:132 stop:245 length:114 start_codon:yes stop_codon:yes gene_type:complete